MDLTWRTVPIPLTLFVRVNDTDNYRVSLAIFSGDATAMTLYRTSTGMLHIYRHNVDGQLSVNLQVNGDVSFTLW